MQGADIVFDQGDIELALQVDGIGIELANAVVVAGHPDKVMPRGVIEKALIPTRFVQGHIDLATTEKGGCHFEFICVPAPLGVFKQHQRETAQIERLVTVGGRGGNKHESYLLLDLV